MQISLSIAPLILWAVADCRKTGRVLQAVSSSGGDRFTPAQPGLTMVGNPTSCVRADGAPVEQA